MLIGATSQATLFLTGMQRHQKVRVAGHHRVHVGGQHDHGRTPRATVQGSTQLTLPTTQTHPHHQGLRPQRRLLGGRGEIGVGTDARPAQPRRCRLAGVPGRTRAQEPHRDRFVVEQRG